MRDADRIVVLQHGRIVEEGAHEQLLQWDGLYARMYWKNQLSFDDADSGEQGRVIAAS